MVNAGTDGVGQEGGELHRYEQSSERSPEITKNPDSISGSAISEYLSDIRHQLRSPIAGIGFLSELLSRNMHRNLTDDQFDRIEAISTATNRLAELVDRIAPPDSASQPPNEKSAKQISGQSAYKDMVERELYFHDFFENAPDVYMSIDVTTGRPAECNRAASVQFGYTKDELFEMQILDLYHSDSRAEAKAAFLDFVDSGEVSVAELKMLRKDGSTFYSSLNATAVRNSQGVIVRSRSIIRDVSSQVIANRESHLALTALNATADMVVITDINGSVQHVNPAFELETGYTLAEVRGRKTSVLKSGHQDKRYYEELWSTILRGEVWSGHLINRRKDGTSYHEEMSITPVMNNVGVPDHFIAIKRDVTEKIRVEEERENARALELENADLVRQNDLRRVFLSQISHELRTPLTALLAFGDILAKNRDGTMSDLQLEQLSHMRRSGWKLDGIISDLLDVSQSETGQFRIIFAEAHVDEIARDAIACVRPLFESKGQQLNAKFGTRLIKLDCDAERISQVIDNLLTNASKYSPDNGVINLHVSHSESEAFIEVTDFGFGIDPKDIPNLFDPFFRVDNEQTKKAGGTGLGLAVTRAIVDMHGGSIEISSEPGKGSSFYVSLPLKQATT